jgi:acyl-CoA synthetase (AMP-forming)/AMP-acid ligase II
LASALAAIGVGARDTVAVMLPNVPAMFEAHFGVPMTGAVLNPLNTRFDAETIAFMLRHSEAKVLLTDRDYSAVVEKALGQLGATRSFIDVDDPAYIVVGSWCGKKFRPDELAKRPGWHEIPAVRDGELHEIKSPLILRPGAGALTDGLDALHSIIVRWATCGRRGTSNLISPNDHANRSPT